MQGLAVAENWLKKNAVSGRGLGRTPCIGLAAQTSSGSLRSHSVSRSAGSFVLGRDASTSLFWWSPVRTVLSFKGRAH